MKKFFNRRSTAFFSTIVLALGMNACSSDSNPESSGKKQFDGSEIVVKDSEGLSLTAESLSGSGTVMFSEPLGSIKSGSNFRLTFTLENEGSLDLVSYADAEQNGGFTATFSRKKSELEVTLAAGEKSIDAGHLEGIDAATTLDLAIDVHNNEEPAHILVWKASDAADTSHDHLEEKALLNTGHEHEEHSDDEEEHEGEGDDEDDHHEEEHSDHDDDEHDDHDVTSPGNGSGTLWGLRLKNATVTAGKASEPIFEE